MLRYREKPFDLNAECARLLNDLRLATGGRRYRALAERILALLSPQAGRYGVAGAGYALAVDEFFESPLQIVVTGSKDASAALRRAALQLPLVNRRVWSMPEGGRIGQLNFPVQAEPVAYISSSRGVSPPVSQPGGLQEALAVLR